MSIATLHSRSDIDHCESKPLLQQLSATNTYTLLQNAATQYTNNKALTFFADASQPKQCLTLNYQQLFAAVNQTARAFKQLGISRHDCVALLLPNIPDMITAYTAAQAVGIAFPIHFLMPPELIIKLLKEAKPRVVIAIDLPELKPLLELLNKECPFIKHILSISPMGNNELQSIAQQQDASPLHHIPNDDDLCAYYHTSGTTGLPKIATFTHLGECYMSWAVVSACAMTEKDVVLSGLPRFHVGAPTLSGSAAWLAGANSVIMTAQGWFDPRVIQHFWDIVDCHNGTITATMAAMYAPLTASFKDKTTLRLAISAETPNAEPILADFKQKTGINVMEIYGQTEASCFSAINFINDAKPGSLGLRLPYEKVSIRKVDKAASYSEACATSQPGMICIKGPNISGYLNKSQQQQAFTHDGFFITGDYGYQDPDGFLWLENRYAYMIQNHRQLINPKSIEACFSAHPQINRCAAIRKTDSTHGELAVLFVEPKDPENPPSAIDLTAWGEGKLPKHLNPSAFVIIETLPLNPLGRVMRAALQQHAEKLESTSTRSSS